MDTVPLYCQRDGFKVPPEEIHVLIIEDDMNTALIEIALFHMMGVQYVYSSSSIAQGLKFVDDVFRVDLVIVDVHVMHAEHDDVWHTLRTHPKLKHARAIAFDDAPLLQEHNGGHDTTLAVDGWIALPEDFDNFQQQVQAIFNQ